MQLFGLNVTIPRRLPFKSPFILHYIIVTISFIQSADVVVSMECMARGWAEILNVIWSIGGIKRVITRFIYVP